MFLFMKGAPAPQWRAPMLTGKMPGVAEKKACENAPQSTFSKSVG
jgi:hypothetical protein